MLQDLKSQGARLGVLSNKFDAAVRQVIGEQFPGVFDIARGECEEIPRKPDPTGVRAMIRHLNVSPDCVAYIGDSVTDVRTARNAGLFCAAVTWGYEERATLQAEGAETLVDDPRELLDL